MSLWIGGYLLRNLRTCSLIHNHQRHGICVNLVNLWIPPVDNPSAASA